MPALLVPAKEGLYRRARNTCETWTLTGVNTVSLSSGLQMNELTV